MFPKARSVLLLSGLIFTCILINRLYSSIPIETTPLSEKTKVDHKHISSHLKNLKHETLITDKEISINNFKDLISYSYEDGKVITRINEDKLEENLKTLINDALKKFFIKRGQGFLEPKGRIYYDIHDNIIEIFFIWGNPLYNRTFTHYDRFSIEIN